MKKLRERLLSEKNIFLAVYLANSWLLNPELLEENDYQAFWNLRDVFNKENISRTINGVQSRLEQILDEKDVFFKTNVYFKPKNQKDGETVFRPLHTASLIDQIAMVAMLQILVYEIGSENQLIPSELSKMLPSHFYGNRISYDGKSLFKPWKEQYHAYIEKANETLIARIKEGTQGYEVNLDLQNFFPSIDPTVLFQFIRSKLPQKWTGEDREIAEVILRKLLLFELEPLDAQEWNWYCGAAEAPRPESRIFAKGQPQGLPHTYFIANLFMLLIQEEYKKVFPGKMLFYVDDSVIFTDETRDVHLDESSFTALIEKLNENIRYAENRLRAENDDTDFLPRDYPFQPKDFGVTVHDPNGKSMFASIEDAQQNSGELYLRGLSRETSNMSFDLSTMFSDEDVEIMLSRTKCIHEKVCEALSHLSEEDADTAIRRKKLLRYKKFFSYRKTILHYRSEGKLKDLMNEVVSIISIRAGGQSLEHFFEQYNDNILDALIRFLLKRCRDNGEDTTQLVDAVEKLCDILYGNSKKHSYLLKSYKINPTEMQSCSAADIYHTLRKKMDLRYRGMREQLHSRKVTYFCELMKELNNLFRRFDLEWLLQFGEHVRYNSSELERRILNAVFSSLFEYNIDDRFIFAKKSRDPIEYSELRILAALKNPNFSLQYFTKSFAQLISASYQCTADYSLLQVMEIFRIFVCDPSEIDQLICIHKYCCDTWKNGSKHLHFYTLHNQEHAVTLIKVAVRWIHALSLFNLKRSDYFILFAACYLHDISMVTLPDYTRFYTGTDTKPNQILTSVESALRKGDTIRSQQALLSAYQEIDAYFERRIRSSHAQDSAQEIRRFRELDFLSANTREFIARVSEAHGYGVLDVYGAKSTGKSELINEKQIKILLRLSDLLDMSRYRVSDVILNHNLSKLGDVSRFHWISHLITDGCDITAEYISTENQQSAQHGQNLLRNGCITEKVVLTVNVLMSQTTPIHTKAPCCSIAESNLSCGADGQPLIKLVCEGGAVCKPDVCNFLCKWFTLKNDYLLKEFGALKRYLNSIPEHFFASEIEIRVKVIADQKVPNDIFDYLRDYVSNH